MASTTPSLTHAVWLQTVGDCAGARRELAQLLQGTPAPAEAAEARYRTAQCYLRDEAAAEAWATLTDLLAAAPARDPHRGPAQFLLGEALAGLGNWPDAEAAYTAYLPLAPELTYLTQQRIGNARRQQGDLAGAVVAYRAALAVSPHATQTTAIRRALADLALAQGKPQEAVAQYDALRGTETTGAWAAEMYYLSANALAKGLLAALLPAATPTRAVSPTPGGPSATPVLPAPLLAQLADAQRRWQAAVDAQPAGPYAHSAIVALLDTGAAVDEYQRGLANYVNGTHQLAIAAFDRLRAADPTGRAGLAWYYAGLSYLALEDTAAGLAQLETFTSTFPKSPQAPDAWLAQGRAFAKSQQTAAALAAYGKVAELYPDSPQAPKALWQIAISQDVEPPREAAVAPYLAVARRYPQSDEGWRAYQNAALIQFRLGHWAQARQIWQEMADNQALPAFTKPVAYFWLGRAQQAAGDAAAAARTWQAAVRAGPDSFYGLRARDWLNDASATRGLSTTQLTMPRSAPHAEQAEIAAWLTRWAGPAASDPAALLAADPDWVRGQALLRLGLRSEALAQWARLPARHRTDGWMLAALAQAFHAAGAHRLSLLSAEQTITLSGQPLATVPVALQRLAYPIPFTDLLRAEAARQGVDPRLLAAIIRQESRFEAGAASVAGAQGLMQVMPGTAQGIAQQMDWPGFEPRQAYWPYVNVAFGAYYIRQWTEHFGGSLFAGLAAYNGGPGNATVWYQWSPQDDDLLAALINITETRVYVQAVWTNYEAYRRLYP